MFQTFFKNKNFRNSVGSQRPISKEELVTESFTETLGEKAGSQNLWTASHGSCLLLKQNQPEDWDGLFREKRVCE